MSFSIVGHCPKCGAPIYVESPWMGILPPPNVYSCNCFNNNFSIEYGPRNTTADGQ